MPVQLRAEQATQPAGQPTNWFPAHRSVCSSIQPAAEPSAELAIESCSHLTVQLLVEPENQLSVQLPVHQGIRRSVQPGIHLRGQSGGQWGIDPGDARPRARLRPTASTQVCLLSVSYPISAARLTGWCGWRKLSRSADLTERCSEAVECAACESGPAPGLGTRKGTSLGLGVLVG